MTAQITANRTARPGRRKTLSVSALAGIGYAAAWIISLSVGAPNPSTAATGRQVVTAFAGHTGPALAQFALNEGVAAVALAAVVISVARAAGRRGHARAGQAAAAFGITVAGVSWAQLAMGTWLFVGLVPDRRAATAGTVYQAITRMDGAKMFLLAAMALAIAQLARGPRVLPAWLAPLGVVLAAALVTSGLGYLLLAPGLSSAVYVSGILLLIFVCATGISLRRRGEHGARAQAVRASSGVGIIGPGQPDTREQHSSLDYLGAAGKDTPR
jgi:hypothetical protein